MGDSLILTSCPVCRARFTGGEPAVEPCRRCGSDLEAIRNAYDWAQYWQNLARYALARIENMTALTAAIKATALVNNQETRRTLAASLLANGRTDAAVCVILSNNP